MNSTDIYRIFHLAAAQYTFFSTTYGTFSKVDHILGHKACLNKYKEIGKKTCTSSDHNEIKLEINSKRNTKNVQSYGD
jgi:exonuclease III